MKRVPVNPKVLRWACERSGVPYENLVKNTDLKNLPKWESGEAQPTLKQAEAFARKVHVPFGYLFLSNPPDEKLSIHDFRTFGGRRVKRPSPELLDTIYDCQERQEWYKDFARETGQPELHFVGSVAINTPVEDVAAKMRETLNFTLENHHRCSNREAALSLLRKQAEDAGVLVMASGIVGNNTSRHLDADEFLGFALSDSLAPLIFINIGSTQAARMFTLAHELAHLWLGSSALSNIDVNVRGFRREEVWCNAVAAEFLVPKSALRKELHEGENLSDTLKRLARAFKVSTLVIMRRLSDVGWLDRDYFERAWEDEKEQLRKFDQNKNKKKGGDPYKNVLARVGNRFANALLISTLEGETSYRDAFQMLGISNINFFNELSRKMEIIK